MNMKEYFMPIPIKRNSRLKFSLRTILRKIIINQLEHPKRIPISVHTKKFRICEQRRIREG